MFFFERSQDTLVNNHTHGNFLRVLMGFCNIDCEFIDRTPALMSSTVLLPLIKRDKTFDERTSKLVTFLFSMQLIV